MAFTDQEIHMVYSICFPTDHTPVKELPGIPLLTLKWQPHHSNIPIDPLFLHIYDQSHHII